MYLDRSPPNIYSKFDMSLPLLEYVDLQKIDRETFSIAKTEYSEYWETYYVRPKQGLHPPLRFKHEYKFHSPKWISSGRASR